MQTIQFQVEDILYNEMIKKGINIQDELKLAFNKILYKKEYQIANDIKKGLDEVELHKSGKIELESLDSFLNRLENAN